MLSTLDTLEADLARLQTYRLNVIAGLDEIGYAEEIGAHDTVQLLSFRYRLDRPQARRDLRLARALPKYPAVTSALPTTAPPDQRGDSSAEVPEATAATVKLHPAQAEAIVSALEKVPATVPVEDLDVAEQQLVGLAQHLSPAELRKAGQRVRDLLDTDGPEPEEHKAYARESLTLTTADHGVSFRGFLANENAELFRSLIHAGAKPHRTITGDLDPRPREKRQADALTATLTIAASAWDSTAKAQPTRTPHSRSATTRSTLTPESAAAGSRGQAAAAGSTGQAAAAGSTGTEDTPGSEAAGTAGAGTGQPRGEAATGDVPGFGAKANITVTIDLQDLKSAAADAIGDTVYGDGLSAAAIRRLACDARILPLVLGSNSEPLDVGRAERLVTRAMRRALNTRDKGCVVCGAPPIMCDAHHLQSWIDGGITAVSNLVLLCRRHHIDLHAGHWTITITNGRAQVSRPAWATPSPLRQQPRSNLHLPSPAPLDAHEPPILDSAARGPNSSGRKPNRDSDTPASPQLTPGSSSAPEPTHDPHDRIGLAVPSHSSRAANASGPATAPAGTNRGSIAAHESLNAPTTTAWLQRFLHPDADHLDPATLHSLSRAATLAIWGTPTNRPDHAPTKPQSPD
jgi:hypothetical protein